MEKAKPKAENIVLNYLVVYICGKKLIFASCMETLKEKTAKGLFWNGLSNGLQQLLNLTFGIFLARTLSSADYGLVGMLTIFSAIAGTIQESGFTAALINKRDVTDRDYNAVFWFSTLAGLTMYMVLFFCAPLIADFYGHEELTPLSRIIFLGFLFSSTSTAHTAMLYKNMKIRPLAKSGVISLALSGCIGVTMALCGMSYWSLAVQSVTFTFLVALSRWHYSNWCPTLKIDFRPLYGMYAFSVKLFFTNIVNQVSGNIYSAILGKFYTPSAVGYYTQGNKWTSFGSYTIMSMIGGIAQPAFAEIGEDKERLRRVLYSLLRFGSFLAFPAMFGLALVSSEFISVTVGDKWLPTVPIMRILCVQGALWPLVNIYNQMTVSRGRSDMVFAASLGFGLFQILLAFIMYPFGIQWMVTAYVLGYFVYLVIWHCLVNRLIGFTIGAALRCTIPYVVSSLAVLAVAYFVTVDVSNIYLRLVLKIAVSVVLYVTVMKLGKSKVLDEGVAFLKQKLRI